LENLKFLDVNTNNVETHGTYCIKNKKSPGYQAKIDWFQLKKNAGLGIKIATDSDNKQLGFIEYLPSEIAWRPVKADNYLFIQCIVVFSKEVRNKNIASSLIEQCELDAKKNKKDGICVITSKGSWMANKSLFEKNGFIIAEKKDRFELMCKSLNDNNPLPSFIDWNKQLQKYKGWNLVYADQCPWHDKSVADLKQAADKMGIDLKIKKLASPDEAQNGPSGFGTFSLINDGNLLADHYISKTRFENILKQEMKK